MNEILALIGNFLWIGIPLIIIIIIVIAVFKVRSSIRKFTKDALGMTPSETMDLIKKGYKEEAFTPKPITSLSEVYAPRIKRDFPNVSYGTMDAMARNSLLASFNAIENESTECMEGYSPLLIDKVNNIIFDNQSRNVRYAYDKLKIHKSGISAYRNSGGVATATFEISLEYYLKKEKDGKTDKKANGQKPTQCAYRVLLSYNQHIHETSNSIIYTSTCPNCGAPVNVAGEKKVCTYCGSGFTEIADRLWQVTDFNLIK